MGKTGRHVISVSVVVALVLAVMFLWCRFAQEGVDAREFQLATVKLLYPAGQVKEITDPNEMQRLVSCFPGLDRRSSYRAGGWVKGADIRFIRADGSVVHVSVSCELDAWSCGQGDLPVEGDLAGLLGDLYPEFAGQAAGP